MNWRVPAVLILWLFLSIFFFPYLADASVTVFDAVAVSGRNVLLKALIKGRLFPEGGRIVDFYVEGRRVGRTMSGGDGYAFLEYLPEDTGPKSVEARSGDDGDKGVILVMKENERVILIELEGGLVGPIFYGKAHKGSMDVLKKLNEKYRLIYISSFIGISGSRRLLKKRALPYSAVLEWGGAELLEELEATGIKVHAIVGSPSILTESVDYVKHRFSFQETDDGTVVEGWKEISDAIESSTPP
jgi:hypothetical protein